MDRFSKYNPKVTILFFIVMIFLNLTFFNPFYLVSSLLCGVFYKFKLSGRGTFLYIFKFILPLIVLISVFNFLFAHYGETVLFAFRDTPFTAQSLFYGFCRGIMFSGVIVWFSCYSQVVTSQHFLSVFGKLSPNIALIFSMVLSFIPRMKKNAEEINDASMQFAEGKSKLKRAISDFSALITMTLEESIEVADSMKARGFTKGRSVYSKYKFSCKDFLCIAFICASAVSLVVFKLTGSADFLFEPVIKIKGFSFTCLAVFTLLSLLPLIIDFTEDIRWHCLKRKI